MSLDIRVCVRNLLEQTTCKAAHTHSHTHPHTSESKTQKRWQRRRRHRKLLALQLYYRLLCNKMGFYFERIRWHAESRKHLLSNDSISAHSLLTHMVSEVAGSITSVDSTGGTGKLLRHQLLLWEVKIDWRWNFIVVLVWTVVSHLKGWMTVFLT